MKELDFIDYISKKFKPRKPVVEGIGDDCAVLEYTRKKYMLFTTDMILEGTHFKKSAPPFKIGWKALAVNISDIASMGGVPKYALVSAGIPKNRNIDFLKKITKGIEAICRKFNILVIGGDTNSADKTVLSVTLIGEVEKKHLIKRSGAKAGDLIFVTGALGSGPYKHLDFLPRLREARILAKNFKISAMIDLSDGLNLDLHRITRASRCGARIYKSLIPVSGNRQIKHVGAYCNTPLRREDTGIDVGAYCNTPLLSAGEDFELLFTASLSESKKIIKRMNKKGNLPVTLIGEIIKKPGVWLVEDKREVGAYCNTTLLKPEGFAHL